MLELVTTISQLITYYLVMWAGSFIIAGVVTRIIEWGVIEGRVVERVIGEEKRFNHRVHVCVSGIIAFLLLFIALSGASLDAFNIFTYSSIIAWMAIDFIAIDKQERLLSKQLRS